MLIKRWSAVSLLLALPFLARVGLIVLRMVADGCPAVPPSHML